MGETQQVFLPARLGECAEHRPHWPTHSSPLDSLSFPENQDVLTRISKTTLFTPNAYSVKAAGAGATLSERLCPARRLGSKAAP